MRAPFRFFASASLVLAGALALRIASRLLARADSLENNVVFITGGSRGLGLAIAMECAKRGARVAICGRDTDALDRAAEQLRAFGSTVLAVRCDVRNREQMASAISQTEIAFGRLDVLINNAGTIAVGPMESMTHEDYEDALKTHFWAMYHAVENALAIFARQGSGRIANITSIGGKVSVPHLLPYCVSKFAAVGYSEGLRAALGPRAVSVTTVVPGLMRTGSPRKAWFKAQYQKEYTWFALSDALPFSSIGARSAARAIVDATLRGDAEIVLSLPAQVAVVLNGIAPGLVSNALQIGARVLPGPGGVDTMPMRGFQSTTKLTESPLTLLSKKAERDYNQI
jgi:NAD(P)-dependent dehydrogenase (short-subunit alcohol dehydrogenase family)